MRVRLEYGRTGLEADLPDRNVVRCLGYRPAEPLSDPNAAIAAALAHPRGTEPLGVLASGRQTACVVICDVTRPVPNRLLLPPILRTLEDAGVPRSGILILVATGLHRPNEGAELAEMVGPEVFGRYRIENHHGTEAAEHVYLGNSPRGVPIWIDRRYVEADVKITTGLIEPHFMAGFSGGRKLVCPGLAALETVRAWHSPAFLEHPRATTGILDNNPVHEENTWIARRAGCDFAMNVALDEHRRVLQVWAGDMDEVLRQGAEFVAAMATDTLPEPVDIVVTSSAGYPLDTTFYQSVKGMVAGMEIVRSGGTIILAASLSEGIGSAEFARIFRENASLDDFMRRICQTDYFVMDQWQVEELAKVRRKARVVVVTDGLPPEVLSGLFVESAPTVEAAVSDCLCRYGPDATIAVVPKGPYVIARTVEG